MIYVIGLVLGPLIIGADPRKLTAGALSILKNTEVIAVNQDALAVPVRLVHSHSADPAQARHVHSRYVPLPAHRTSAGAVDGAGAGAGCVGYFVSGAGTDGVNGCYTASGQTWALDATHQLYSFKGDWHIGSVGHSVSYTTLSTAPIPPESVGGCGTVWSAEQGSAPCPAVKRSGLPPPPPPPPPAPPTPGMPAGPGTKLKMATCTAVQGQNPQAFRITAMPAGICADPPPPPPDSCFRDPGASLCWVFSAT